MPDISIYKDFLLQTFKPDTYTVVENMRNTVHKLYYNNGFLMTIDVWDREESGVCYGTGFVHGQIVFPLTYFKTKTECIEVMKTIKNTYAPSV